MTLTREQIAVLHGAATHEDCWVCDLRDTALAYHDLREATRQHTLDLLGRVHSAEQKQARAEETLLFVRVERDNADADVERLTRERDAYRKAKAENDERFMLERNDARAEAEVAREEQREAVEEALRLTTEVERLRAELATRTEMYEQVRDPGRVWGQ